MRERLLRSTSQTLETKANQYELEQKTAEETIATAKNLVRLGGAGTDHRHRDRCHAQHCQGQHRQNHPLPVELRGEHLNSRPPKMNHNVSQQVRRRLQQARVSCSNAEGV